MLPGAMEKLAMRGRTDQERSFSPASLNPPGSSTSATTFAQRKMSGSQLIAPQVT